MRYCILLYFWGLETSEAFSEKTLLSPAGGRSFFSLDDRGRCGCRDGLIYRLLADENKTNKNAGVYCSPSMQGHKET